MAYNQPKPVPPISDNDSIVLTDMIEKMKPLALSASLLQDSVPSKSAEFAKVSMALYAIAADLQKIRRELAKI